MSGAISLLPQYVFMAWCLIEQWIRFHNVTHTQTGTSLPLNCVRIYKIQIFINADG
jgi:hypothetical protein